MGVLSWFSTRMAEALSLKDLMLQLNTHLASQIPNFLLHVVTDWTAAST